MSQVMGAANRQDGRAKVTGKATYAAEHQILGLLHGYLVTASTGNGRIKSIDTSQAETAKGVVAVFTHKNPPKICKPTNDFSTSKIYEERLPLSDAQVHYGGQIIGLVVADTFEQAKHAAHLVKVEYETQSPLIEFQKATFKEAPPFMGEELKFEKGNVATVNNAAAKIEATYTTTTELHEPMEPCHYCSMARFRCTNNLRTKSVGHGFSAYICRSLWTASRAGSYYYSLPRWGFRLQSHALATWDSLRGSCPSTATPCEGGSQSPPDDRECRTSLTN